MCTVPGGAGLSDSAHAFPRNRGFASIVSGVRRASRGTIFNRPAATAVPKDRNLFPELRTLKHVKIECQLR